MKRNPQTLRSPDPSINHINGVKNRPKRSHVGAALLLTAGLVGGGKIMHAIDEAKTNARQPACEVPVQPGDGVWSIDQRLKLAGDNTHGEDHRTVTPSGTERDPAKQMQAGDLEVVSHVDPLVCEKVGGQVVAAATSEAHQK